MSEPTAAPDRKAARWRLAAWLAFGVPAGLGGAWCVLMRPELLSPLAPLLGPWAGNLYGHTDCTMASQLPGWSWGAAGLGAVALTLVFLTRRRHGPLLALLPGALWSLLWSGLATLSVLNTTS